MRSYLALSIAAFAGMAAAQEQYTIDPSTVAESDRQYWCQQQIAMCPLICLQQPGVTTMTTESNDCDSDDLTYDCVCDNGVAPNITQYSQTLPYFICTTWGTQCVANCGTGGNTCASACLQDHPCGAQNPYLGNATSSSVASTASATGSGTAAASSSGIPVTGFGGAASTSGSGSSGTSGATPATIIPAATLGMAAVFGSVFLGFAILL